MFCDLVDSTALAARLDPEDLREVVTAYHHAVADVVRSFDGFVAKYMGDGVLIYFGYGRSHHVLGLITFVVLGGLLIWTAPNRWGVGIALHYLSRVIWPDPSDPIPASSRENE